MKRTVVLVILAAALLALLAVPLVAYGESASPMPFTSPEADSSAAPETPASPAAGKVIYRLGTTEVYDGFNPFANWSGSTWDVFRNCYNFLTWYDQDYKVAPDFASSWTVSPDGKEWTFTTRSDMKWSDGVPMTAHDAAFTYNWILRTEQWAYIQYLDGVQKVEAPDDTTLVITCDKPSAGMLALYIPILPEHVWSKVKDKDMENVTGLPLVGSGPYRLGDVKKDKWIQMLPNPDYPEELGGPPKVDEFWYVFSQNADSMVEDFKSGVLDGIMGFPASYYNVLKQIPGTSVAKSPAIGFHELGFNVWDDPKSGGNPLLKDVAVRQALNYAIDKKSIVSVAMGGLAPEGTSLISPVQGIWHYQVPESEQYTFDPEKARQILADAGYKDTDGDGVLEAPNGKKLEFRYAAFNEYPEDQAAAKKIVSYAKDVGIKLDLQVMDEGAFSDQAYDNGNDDMFMWNWRGDIDPGFMLSTFTTKQILNWGDSNYSNPEYDQLYKDQLAAVDPADPNDTTKRAEIVHQMQGILYRDSPYIIMWYNVNLQAYNTARWQGYVLVPPKDGAPFFNLIRGTYQELTPKVADTSGTTSGGGSSTGLYAVLAIVGLGVVAIVIWLVSRRRRAEVE